MKALCALVAACFAGEVSANPTGPAVVSGAATFTSAGSTLTVTNSPNAIINWRGFSIGAGEATRFQQQSASSAVLNRVVGQDPSAILGTLWSNGRVFLVNPNGILFGQGSRVDVAGLVASTLNITDGDFLGGRLKFQAGAVANSIVNQGEVHSATGGNIYLVSPDITNSGVISSPSGEIILAAGKSVSLVDIGTPNLKVEVTADPGQARNLGRMVADSGRIGVYAGLINQQGVVRADTATQDATGRIVFKASDTTLLEDGSVTSAAGAKGGEIQVLGNKVGLTGNAQVDASGETGGGTVLVGGDYQGNNPGVQNAFRTYFGPSATIKADAITSGDGGKVIVWSDDATRAYGAISARGGAQSGNGGFVEVSGKRWLDFTAIVDTRAPMGKAGSLLLDPSDITITDDTVTEDFGGGGFTGTNPLIFDGNGADVTALIRWSTIKSNLTGADVYITTCGDGCGSGSGIITISKDSPDLATANTLRLLSGGNIQVNGSISNTLSGAIEMYAGWNNGPDSSSPTVLAGTGDININKNVLSSGGGAIRLIAGNNVLVQNATVATSGTMTINANALGVVASSAAALLSSSGTQSITVGAGGVTVSGGTGTGLSAQIAQGPSGTQDITVNSGGTVVLNGGSGSNANFVQIVSNGTAQTITFNGGGGLFLLGGTVGTLNYARLWASNATVGAQTQTVTGANGITLAGGASGGGLDLSNNGLGNFAEIRNSNGSQNLSVGAGGLTLTGGGGLQTNNYAMIIQGSSLASAAGTSQTITVGGGGVISLEGGSSALTNVIDNVDNFYRGSFALIQANGDSQQINFTSGGELNLTGGTVGSNNPAQIYARVGLQTISGSPDVTLTGGASGGYVDQSISKFEGNYASIRGEAGQSITASSITMTGGGGGVDNIASITQVGTSSLQSISATSISLSGGAGGGYDPTNANSTWGNFSLIQSNGSQQINVGSLGLTLTGGGGSFTDNAARIEQLGTTGTQTINVNNGFIVLQGGDSAGTNVGGTGHGSRASIYSEGSLQQINFTGGGFLSMTGGSVGSRNFAQIFAENTGSQTITGSPTITLIGGESGGITGEGNAANIATRNGSQNITASWILLMGGSGTENYARIDQGGSTGTQTITVTDVEGPFISLQGGDGPSSNYARILSSGTAQFILGSPSIFLTGGPTGGMDGGNGPSAGNYALIQASVGQQTIVASDMTLQAGTSGVELPAGTENFAAIVAPVQNITVHGDLAMFGGDSQPGTLRAGGAKIGGVGGNAPTPTDLTLIVDGNLQLTGGAVSGANIGNASLGGQTTDIEIDVGGSITLTGGAAGGASIGSTPATNVAGGTISITAQEDITLGNGSANAGTAVRTLGSVLLASWSGVITVNSDATVAGSSIALNSDIGFAGTGAINAGTGTVTLATFSSTRDLVFEGTANSGHLSIQPSALSNITAGGIVLQAGQDLSVNTSLALLDNRSLTLRADSDANGIGDLALNGGIVLTGGNATLMSGGSITQTTGSILVGGSTSLVGGTILLTSSGNDFTGAVSITGTGSGNVAIADANGIILGTSSLGTGNFTVAAGGSITQSGAVVQSAGAGQATFQSTGGGAITLTNSSNDFTGPVDLETTATVAISDANSFVMKGGGGGGSSPVSLTINANGTVSQSGAFGGSAPASVTINAGSGNIVLNDPANNFTGNTSAAVSTTGSVSFTNLDSGGINLAASGVGGALSLTSGGPITQTGAITVGGASTINAGANPITLNAANDFLGTVNLTGSNVSITDVNSITLGALSVSGTLTINALSTSFLSGFSATNFSFSGGNYTLAAGTYSLGGTTTVSSAATVTVSGATVNASTINVSGVLDASGSVTGSINLEPGGTLKGTGTIVGNVTNSAGTVAPGASPGTLTISGNYVQGPAGVLSMDIGGLLAGDEYDQLVVSGTATLGGTLNTSLINGFVPVSGQAFTFVQASGGVTGTFTTIHQPLGALFNSFYGLTTFEFIAASSSAAPAPIAATFNYTSSTTDQVLTELTNNLTSPTPDEEILVAPIVATTTTTAEGTVAVKPPACN